MSKTQVIAIREYLATVRTKAFLIGILLGPVIGFIAVLVGRIDEGESFADIRQPVVLVTDREELVARVKNRAPQVDFQRLSPKEMNEKRKQVLDKQLMAKDIAMVVEIASSMSSEEILTEKSSPPNGELAFKNSASVADFDFTVRTLSPTRSVVRSIKELVKEEIRYSRLSALGMAPEQLEWALAKIRSSVIDPSEDAKPLRPERLIVPVLSAMLMMMTILGGSSQLLNVVVEEKQQRIAEVLLGSVSPIQLMLGKLIGSLGVGLTTLFIYVAAGVAYAQSLGYGHLISLDIVVSITVNVVLALLMYGSMMLACGAASNDLKDAQAFMTPMMLVIAVPFMFLTRILESPNDTLSTVLSLVPLFAPMLMPFRMGLSTEVPTWQVCFSMIGEVGFAVGFVWIASRIFRVGILAQGKRPSLGQLWRWLKQ